MKTIKLSEWCEKTGVKYLTAWRWFKANKMPVYAYQTESGTILVEDEDIGPNVINNVSNDQVSDAMSLFVKKTVEFSKNNSPIEDFAAWILSTFTLKINYGPDTPKYSRNKPKSEDIQKHFQQFIKKGEKPKVNMFIADESAIDSLVAQADNLTAQELVEEIHKIGEQGSASPTAPVPELTDLLKAFSTPNNPPVVGPRVYDEDSGTVGLISRNVDLNSTPQPINYTSSTTDQTYGDLSFNGDLASSTFSFDAGTTCTGSTAMPFTGTLASGAFYNSLVNGSTFAINTTQAQPQISLGVIPQTAAINNVAGPTGAFKPTQKELESASKLTSAAPRKRGRKPSKNKR